MRTRPLGSLKSPKEHKRGVLRLGEFAVPCTCSGQAGDSGRDTLRVRSTVDVHDDRSPPSWWRRSQCLSRPLRTITHSPCARGGLSGLLRAAASPARKFQSRGVTHFTLSHERSRYRAVPSATCAAGCGERPAVLHGGRGGRTRWIGLARPGRDEAYLYTRPTDGPHRHSPSQYPRPLQLSCLLDPCRHKADRTG